MVVSFWEGNAVLPAKTGHEIDMLRGGARFIVETSTPILDAEWGTVARARAHGGGATAARPERSALDDHFTADGVE